MTNAINPNLYSLLLTRFGKVQIHNMGDSALVNYKTQFIKSGVTLKKQEYPNIESWGEAYAVDCPYCHDHYGRLWFCHLYGTTDSKTNIKFNRCVHCYNERCNTREIHRLLDKNFFHMPGYKVMNPIIYDSAGKIIPIKMEPKLPKTVVELTSLSEEHIAIKYLKSRNFDPVDLQNNWKVGYCSEPHPDQPSMRGRIIFPVIADSKVIGCQGRHVPYGTESSSKFGKYVTCTGFHKSRYFFNHDAVKTYKTLVLVEGPLDAIAVGSNSIAAMGKDLSKFQLNYLLDNIPKEGTLFVLLDSDATKAQNKAFNYLKSHAYFNLINVTLDNNKDPGEMTRLDIWAALEKEAQKKSISLVW